MADLQAKLQTSEAKLEDMARTQASLFSEMERLKDDLRNQTIEAVREELMSKVLCWSQRGEESMLVRCLTVRELLGLFVVFVVVVLFLFVLFSFLFLVVVVVAI